MRKKKKKKQEEMGQRIIVNSMDVLLPTCK